MDDLVASYYSANARQQESYALCIELLNSVSDNATFEVRGVNGGDIAESVLKYHLYGNAELTYSRQGIKDLEGMKVSEVKYFGATNNTPNGTLTPKAFLSVSKYGVHHFTYDIVKKHFKDFKLDKRKGTRAMTYSMMKDLVLSGQVKRVEYLSNAIGL